MEGELICISDISRIDTYPCVHVCWSVTFDAGDQQRLGTWQPTRACGTRQLSSDCVPTFVRSIIYSELRSTQVFLFVACTQCPPPTIQFSQKTKLLLYCCFGELCCSEQKQLRSTKYKVSNCIFGGTDHAAAAVLLVLL